MFIGKSPLLRIAAIVWMLLVTAAFFALRFSNSSFMTKVLD